MASAQIHHISEPGHDPEGVAGLLAVRRAIMAELDPDDPPQSDAELRWWFFGVGPDRNVRTHLATIDGRPVGSAWAMTVSHPDDELQLAIVEISVVAADRGRGVATALIAELVPELVALGQTSVLVQVCDGLETTVAEAMCDRHGLTERSADRTWRAAVSDIDPDLMAGWIADAETTAAGYRLEQWEGPCPEHLAQRWVEAVAAMEDEPRGDAEYNPYTWTAEQQRLADEEKLNYEIRLYRTLAIGPDGDAAGLTEMRVHADSRGRAVQGDTAVVAGHRGHRLGRWMKAANLARVRDAHPDVALIETSMAEANPWMMAINEQMGFRPHHRFRDFQGPLDGIVEAMERYRGRPTDQG